MSMDTVDDLHYAEDTAGTLAHHLRAVLDAGLDPDKLGPAWAQAETALGGFDEYCRPTCGARDGDECLEGDTCGCLCGHADEDTTEDEA